MWVIPFSFRYEIRREAADSAVARQGEATTYRIEMEMEMELTSIYQPVEEMPRGALRLSLSGTTKNPLERSGFLWGAVSGRKTRPNYFSLISL